MAVKVRTEFNGKIGIIDVRGSLVGDEETDKFREAVQDFIEQGIKSVIINLQKVTYMNSSGIGALIAAHTSYRKIDGEIRLAGLTSNVQNLLIVTKLIDIFDVHDDVANAIDHFLKIKTI